MEAQRITINYMAGDGTRTALSVFVSDNSYRSREIMGDDKITLEFSLPQYTDISNAHCNIFGTDYYSFAPPQVNKFHDRSYAYTLEMYSEAHLASITMFRDIVLSYDTYGSYTGGNRISFALTAQPKEHLRMVIDNMNYKAGLTRSSASGQWHLGDCVDEYEKCIPYDDTTVLEALNNIAEIFDAEWEIDTEGRKISLRKVQPADTPLPLGYGENKGLKSGVARSVSSGRETIDRVFVKGSEQNIDPSNYGKFSEIYYAGQFIRHAVYDAKSRSLMLPSGGKIWYNGSVFKPYRPVVGDTPVTNLYQYIGKVDDESGLPNNPTYTASVPEVGNTDGYTLYEVTPDRLAVQVAGYTPAYNGHIVDGLYDGTDIYPKRTGKVDSVDTPDTTNIDTYDELPQPSASTLNKIYHVSDNDKWYIGTFDQDRDPQYDFEELDGKNAPLVDFYDKDDDCPDYTQCSIKGEVMTVIFQSGMLAGKEFELNTNTDGTVVTPYIDGLGRKFEIVPQEIDGQVMPSPVGGYMPKSGDKYAIFHCRLPFQYIRRDIGSTTDEQMLTWVGTVDAVESEPSVLIINSDPSRPNFLMNAIDGHPISITFNNGPLANKTFTCSWRGSGCYLIARQYNGQTMPMPGTPYMPQAGNSFTIQYMGYVTNYRWLLQGAEWDLMREAVKYLYDHSEATYTVSASFDPIWLKENYESRLMVDETTITRLTVREYLHPGCYVTIDDSHIPKGRVFRIMSLQQKINNPYNVTFSLSDSLKSTGRRTRLVLERGASLIPTDRPLDTAIIQNSDKVTPSQE